MKEITTVGVDLAKSVFTVHGVDAAGRVVLRKTVRRERLLQLIAGLPPCLIGMEPTTSPTTIQSGTSHDCERNARTLNR